MTTRRAVLAGAVLIVSLGFAALTWARFSEPSQPASKTTDPRPAVYCEFYNFMHNAVVVGFNFAVGRDAGANPTFAQLFVVEHDGTRTDFDDNPPRWVYQIEDETPSIRSPDSETRIILYGLKPKRGGVFWTEAGIRSNTYRNLEGKCRQAHLDKARTGAAELSRRLAQ